MTDTSFLNELPKLHDCCECVSTDLIEDKEIFKCTGCYQWVCDYCVYREHGLGKNHMKARNIGLDHKVDY